MEVVAFDKAKFDVFMGAVVESLKEKPTIMGLLGNLLNQATVPIQIMPRPEPTAEEKPLTSEDYAALDSNNVE
jgi:hypothetical protein